MGRARGQVWLGVLSGQFLYQEGAGLSVSLAVSPSLLSSLTLKSKERRENWQQGQRNLEGCEASSTGNCRSPLKSPSSVGGLDKDRGVHTDKVHG